MQGDQKGLSDLLGRTFFSCDVTQGSTFEGGIVALIKAAVTGEAAVLPADFDWKAAHALAVKHQIVPMLYYGIANGEYTLPEDVKASFEVLTYQSIAVSENQLYEFERVSQAFEKNGIVYMPLKGIILKQLYPQHEMRSMGDLDILIKPSQYEAAESVMTALGFEKLLESDHELVWKKANHLHIELHKRLVPSYDKDYYAYYGEGWRLAKPVASGTRYEMSNEDEMIYLLVHFAKHYRGAGIGIRQLVDLWVYRRAHPMLDECYIQGELEKIALFEFYQNILKTIAYWFEGGEGNAVTAHITAVIFNSGVFGTTAAKELSLTLRASRKSGGKSARSARLLHEIFLPLSLMEKQFPVLKKVPVLLPVMWFVRIFRTLFFRSNTLKRKADIWKYATPDRVVDYEEALRFVGLDFNYKE